VHSYKELRVWKRSIDLAKEVYELTSSYPKSEQYNLVSQMNRSAISIPSNIAEGAGRGTNKDFINFLGYAQGSAFELETQLILSNELSLITNQHSEKLLEFVREIQKMNFTLKKSLSEKS